MIIVNIENSDWKGRAKTDFGIVGFAVKTFKTRIDISYLYKTFKVYKFKEQIYIATIPKRFYETFRNSIIFKEDILKNWIEIENQKKINLEKKKNVIAFSAELFEMQLVGDLEKLGFKTSKVYNNLKNDKYVSLNVRLNDFLITMNYSIKESFKKLDTIDLYKRKWLIGFSGFNVTKNKYIEIKLNKFLEIFSEDVLRNLFEEYNKLQNHEIGVWLGDLEEIENKILEIFTKG